jgi:AcrR family transcriptional regulator
MMAAMLIESTSPLPAAAPDSRVKILEIAEPLFATAGYAGVGMRQLAGLVGLSKSALFHHFPSKQTLYAAVLDRAMERIEQALAREARVGEAARVQLEAWIDAIVTTLAGNESAGRLLMRAMVEEEPFSGIRLRSPFSDQADRAADQNPPAREPLAFELRLDAILARFSALLERGAAQGEFRAVPIADALLNVIGATVFYFASGPVGDSLIGASIFSPEAVERRRRELKAFIGRGLLA